MKTGFVARAGRAGWLQGWGPTSIPAWLTSMVVLSLFALPLLGQGTVGSIVGTVTTSDGSVVPNARVTITKEGTTISGTLKAIERATTSPLTSIRAPTP